ncbi:hypothetical protein QMA77_21135 [Pantoea ananatis]|uniref:hypothetical protein n=1 Tax=Pantoea ananas TaxID=553 RepID=UPI0006A2210A|nr:hypothetical protein [Pantoea ananatis]KNA28142.1 hypothetical protein ACO03_03880 [Pantoea ananatis]MDI6539435.1 hypothetical protein [Pantoea ananatis]
MNKDKYYEMLTFMGAAIQEAHKVIVEEFSLQNEDQNEVMEHFNQLITSLAMGQVINEYGQSDSILFFNKFGKETSESLSNHIGTMVSKGDALVRFK